MSCKILLNNTITDKDFLELMIKHHNVAVKMSQMIMIISLDDVIVDFARRTIFNQSNEVNLMEKLLKHVPNLQNEKSCNNINSVITSNIEKLYPNIFANLKCNENHFEHNTNEQIQLSETTEFETLNHHENVTTKNKPITELEYINHMIEHHKSGIDLAKLLIKSTKEPKLLIIAQTMIFDQEKEIFMIKNLYGCIKYNWRNNM